MNYIDYADDHSINETIFGLRTFQKQTNLLVACAGKSNGGYCADDCDTFYVNFKY